MQPKSKGEGESKGEGKLILMNSQKAKARGELSLISLLPVPRQYPAGPGGPMGSRGCCPPPAGALQRLHGGLQMLAHPHRVEGAADQRDGEEEEDQNFSQQMWWKLSPVYSSLWSIRFRCISRSNLN